MRSQDQALWNIIYLHLEDKSRLQSIRENSMKRSNQRGWRKAMKEDGVTKTGR